MSNPFYEECVRKGELLEYLVELEDLEGRRRKSLHRGERKYTRMFKGRVTVSEIFRDAAHFVRPHGERLLNVPLTPEICDLLMEGEELFATMGLRQKTWRLVSIEYICTPLPDGPVFQPELPRV